MGKYIQVITTLPSTEEAEKLSKLLVEKRLAACVQIIRNIISFYWWNENIEKSNETMLLIKTKEFLFEEIVNTIKRNHPYRTPEIISLPIISLNKEYEEWLEKELK